MSLRSKFDDGLVLIDTRHVIGDQVMGWGQGLTRCHRDTRHLSLNYYPGPRALLSPDTRMMGAFGMLNFFICQLLVRCYSCLTQIPWQGWN